MKNLFVALLIFSSCLIQIYSQQTSDADDWIKIDTSLVVVPVKVTNRRDKNITDLKRENFRIFEDGIEQRIENFEDGDAPFTIALALDVSDSTAGKAAKIKAAAIAFLTELRPRDRVLIFTFDQNLYKIADGTVENLSNIQNSIAFSQTGGGTSLYDATADIISEYLGKLGGKKALILFTDGIDTQSVRQNFASSARLAEEADVLVYSIQYETVEGVAKDNSKIAGATAGASVRYVTAKGEPLPTAYKRGSLYLNTLAFSTGGDFFFADTLENLSKTFSKIARQLSQIYSLSYYPQNEATDGKRRRLKVTVDRPQTVVRARKSYVFNRAKK